MDGLIKHLNDSIDNSMDPCFLETADWLSFKKTLELFVAMERNIYKLDRLKNVLADLVVHRDLREELKSYFGHLLFTLVNAIYSERKVMIDRYTREIDESTFFPPEYQSPVESPVEPAPAQLCDTLA